MEERLQKILAARADVSRRAAEAYIRDGRVTVNGHTAELGEKADPDTAVICLDGAELGAKEHRLVYVMLNKPVGYVTTMSDEKGRKTVRELVADIDERVYPVGRLDINSEGLLLMTNDGDFANHVMHPSGELEKVYRVTVVGDIEKGLKALREPMELEDGYAEARRVKLLKMDGASAAVDITITEGRNRQIRRMCEKAGLSVRRLTRISEGGVSLGRLKKGTWRHLTADEIRRLKNG